MNTGMRSCDGRTTPGGRNHTFQRLGLSRHETCSLGKTLVHARKNANPQTQDAGPVQGYNIVAVPNQPHSNNRDVFGARTFLALRDFVLYGSSHK